MDATRLLTAEEFADSKYDLPDGGRWTELVDGQVKAYAAVDDIHGNVVRNLSAALANHAQKTQQGYAGFELGLIVSREPDTVRCPAISYFVEGERFAELDNIVTDTRPALVVEVASSNDRRRGLDQRLQSYLDWGVPMIWVIDTQSHQVHLFETGKRPRLLADYETLFGGAALPGFTMLVGNLFADPKWWTG